MPGQLVSQEPQGHLALEIPVQELALALVQELVQELALVLELVQGLEPVQAELQGPAELQERPELQVPPPGDRQGS